MTIIEPEVGPSEPLQDALMAFTACIGEALVGVCSYGLTMGGTYIPFMPDPDDDFCEEDEAICSQAWVRVMSVQPAEGGNDGWGGDCALTLALELEVGIQRCVEIPEGGEAPTASDVMAAALMSMEDMTAIQCAASNCEAWGNLSVGSWRPFGPTAGEYGGVWTFSVGL